CNPRAYVATYILPPLFLIHPHLPSLHFVFSYPPPPLFSAPCLPQNGEGACPSGRRKGTSALNVTHALPCTLPFGQADGEQKQKTHVHRTCVSFRLRLTRHAQGLAVEDYSQAA